MWNPFRDRERDLDRELRFHLEEQKKDYVEGGLSQAEARRRTYQEFGGMSQIREACRDVRPLAWLSALGRDVRIGWRFLFRRGTRVSAGIALISLAVGIAGSTLVFSIVESVLLRPFPYADPDALVLVLDMRSLNDGPRFSAADLVDYRNQAGVFDGLAFYSDGRISPGNEAEVPGVTVGRGLFELLGVEPVIGPGFPDSAQDPGRLVLLSYGFWESRYGGDTGIVGDTLNINSNPYQIVGVMPRGFFFPRPDVELWLFSASPASPSRLLASWWAVGRLTEGITVDAAQSAVDIVSERLDSEYPRPSNYFEDGWQQRAATLLPIRESVVSSYRTALYFLQGGVGLVLLIACANVAGLLLTRGVAREKELAVRASLGAGRLALIRQLLVDSILISSLAGGAGVLLAFWGLRLVLRIGVLEIPRFSEATINVKVFLFAASISLAAGVVSGLFPAVKVSRVQLAELIKRGGLMTSRAGGGRFRDGLVVAEVAAAVVMTIGAGLFIRSAIGLAEIEWGFDTDDVSVVTFRVRTGASMLPFSETVIERVRLLPFVEAVSAGTTAPIVAPETFFLSEAMMERVLADSSAVLSSVVASRSVITRDYFRALGVDVRGREFDERDVAGALPTVILSETLARRVFSDREPIGQRVHFLRLRDGVSALESNGSVSAERLTVGGSFDLADFVVPGTTVHTVIGVAQDVKMTGDTEGPLGGPRVYLDYRQAGAEVRIGEVDVGGSVNVPTTFVLRTKGDPQTALEAVKSIMVEADPRVELREAAPVQSLIFGALDGGGRMRLMLILSSVFGFLAVVLSAAGVYGALSQRVSQRTHEIGVRMALGARPWGVLRMILVQGLRMTAIGLVLGLVGAWVASRSLEAMLFGVTATDILTYAIMTLILLGVAAGASMVPALRASRVDPMLALRHE